MDLPEYQNTDPTALQGADTDNTEPFVAVVLPMSPYPAHPRSIFRCQACLVRGAPGEGALVSIEPFGDRVYAVLNIGRRVPPVGEILLVHDSHGQLIADY